MPAIQSTIWTRECPSCQRNNGFHEDHCGCGHEFTVAKPVRKSVGGIAAAGLAIAAFLAALLR